MRLPTGQVRAIAVVASLALSVLVTGCMADSAWDEPGGDDWDDYGADGDVDVDADADGDVDGDWGWEDPSADGTGVPDNNDNYEDVGTNPFTETTYDPFSTFAADVDTASYEIFLRDVGLYETLPSPLSVRLEEYVNYFDYDYEAPAPGSEVPFAIHLAAAPHPMGRDMALLRVGIQAEEAPPYVKPPANLVFLIDVSGSMSSSDKLPLVQRVLTETLEVLDPTDTVSIVTYAGSTGVALPPTPVSEASAIRSVIASFTAGGSTAGAAGIDLAYEQAEAAFIEGGLNHVILCTDGDFNVGISDTEALVTLIEEKRETGVTLTALGFGRGNLNDAMMERVSNAGNGMYSVIIDEDHAVEYVHERMLRTVHHVAKDMKIQVEFNPAYVLAYRLLGYENRAIADDDFRDDTVDAGEVGAGHRVTALYELVLVNGSIPEVEGAPEIARGEPVEGEREIGAGDLVLVQVRYKDVGATVDDPAHEVSAALAPEDILGSSAEAGDDFLWAAAVAAFAEILKGSPYGDLRDLDTIQSILESQRSRDGERSELADLFLVARGLLGE